MRLPLFVICAVALTIQANDPVTNLPLYPSAGGPIAMPAGSFCKSQMEANFYTMSTEKLADVTQWYVGHLKGFHRYHSSGHGHSQDTFFNATGTLEVSVTGSSTDSTLAYSVSYGKFTPGLSPLAMQTFNLDNQRC